MLSTFAKRFRSLQSVPVRSISGAWGEGVGHGGGGGGTIRDAGGAFGKREAAFEEKYFRAQQQEQLKALKDHMQNEIRAHEKSIRAHEEAIARHKKQIKNMEHH